MYVESTATMSFGTWQILMNILHAHFVALIEYKPNQTLSAVGKLFAGYICRENDQGSVLFRWMEECMHYDI